MPTTNDVALRSLNQELSRLLGLKVIPTHTGQYVFDAPEAFDIMGKFIFESPIEKMCWESLDLAWSNKSRTLRYPHMWTDDLRYMEKLYQTYLPSIENLTLPVQQLTLLPIILAMRALELLQAQSD